jgi:hypothetical protein
MTAPPSADEVAAIAKGLTEAQAGFIKAVGRGGRLWCADREEDRTRQSTRRRGLTVVLKSPRRWVLTPLGLAVRNHLIGRDAMSTESHNRLAPQILGQIVIGSGGESDAMVVLESIIFGLMQLYRPTPRHAAEYLDVMTAQVIERMRNDPRPH